MGADYNPGYAGQHPQTYSEEIRLRRLQEVRDRVVARNMQNTYEYDFGNTAGHHMNENYRRDHGALPSRPPPANAGYVSGVQQARGGYGASFLERQSSTRSRSGRQPSPAAPPLRYQPGYENLPLRRGSHGHHRSVDEREYRQEPQRSQSERIVPTRMSRRYDDEAAIHSPYSRGRRASVGPPRSSAMAGLNGKDRGMGRVAEWRDYVEDGVPDGESVAGHL
ncbi:hypothetical protein ISF_03241 [Cordyceps fumosorosea ARSEF 2679]|uniref:Uncharacterized protein n=1 Tax=Cordyceps fumosorosea (strain ARSEF 2679) TaxID=1081104 RepID=A0A168AK91_CORFA|nr:hypothetical protein ISF_03241 [Cordyceps fumosorosea ARSEF 2679]OAA68866.1 hypothetical protein ISF_03241 [Cordyceps fumosorosea ARSEF 2679]